MELPDVIGYKMEDAFEVIKASGFTVDTVVLTKSIKAAEPAEITRIVRLLPVDETRLQVVVAYQLS